MESRTDDIIHMIRIDPGEKIMATLLNYLDGKRDEIPSGFLTGIGAAGCCEIGWYDLDESVYKTKVIDENCEITSLVGNIAWVDGKPIAHIHITLGKSDYSIVGGHLVEGTVSVTCEIYIRKSSIPVVRTPCKFKGLKLIEFEN